MSGQMKTFRSLLFVPGIRPERFDKAIAAGADAVCIDLEDAVPPHEKDAARAAVLDFISAKPEDRPCAVGVRINPIDTTHGLKDLLAFKETGAIADFLMLPKAEATRDFSIIDSVLGLSDVTGNGFLKTRKMKFWAVIETVLGLANASDLAAWCGTRGGILFGGADFSASIGTNMDWEPLFYARSKLATKTKLVHGGLLDVPFLDTKDAAGLRAECTRVKALGFLGKACIHPNQVAIVNEVFSPSGEDIAWAKRVAEAQSAEQGGVVLLDGKLLDAPVYLRAQRILTQAGIEI
jgi:(S)-citramalyl-CoA lyase